MCIISSLVHPEQQPRAAKALKEMALKRHGKAIQHALAEAKQMGDQQAVHELIQRVRKHIEAQQIVARDLLNEGHQ